MSLTFVEERGLKNEGRFFTLAQKLCDALRESPTVLNANCFRSGRHYPRKGLVDWEDRDGQDVLIRLVSYPSPSASFVSSSFIYDVKSSEGAARKFNRKIRRGVGQKKACIKRAIVTNESRTDLEIIGELISDFSSAGVLPAGVREEILSRFVNPSTLQLNLPALS